jgi:hypothetical protein
VEAVDAVSSGIKTLHVRLKIFVRVYAWALKVAGFVRNIFVAVFPRVCRIQRHIAQLRRGG